MSLRILIGLLIAAAVALVPVANVLVLRWWPPPDFSVKLQPCSEELPPHVPCLTGDQRPRRLIARGTGPGVPPPDAPVEADVDGPHFVHGEAGIPGGPAAGQRMMRVISFGGPDMAMGGPDMQPLRRHFMMVNLISLALVVSLAVLLVSVLLRAPFRALIGAIGDIERGAAPPAWAFSGPVEFRRVGHALEKLGRQLRSNLQERELMLAGLSHDIRSPLARIQAALELRSTDSERWIDTLRDVREIDHIIGQCIDFARDGQDEPLHSSSLDRIVTDTLGAPDAQGWCTAGARLELGAPQPQLLRVGALRRALRNLVDNALQHGEAPVVVRTRTVGGSVELSVEDAGVGIADGAWDLLRKPFSRGSSARTPGGCGLGLAIVQRVVTMHGGQLERRRGADGSGFCVVLRLPLVCEPGV
ncbi:MAG: ATP-binding protein [Pseudomonadota bacterium]|nr:ATP-binding protein [Pseudomonadota bacterium]